VALLPGQRVCIWTLQESGNRLVELLLVLSRFEGAGDQFALGILDVFQHLAAQDADAEKPQPVAQVIQIAAGIHVLGAIRRQVAKNPLINQRGHAVQLEECILQGCGGQQDLTAVFQRPTNALAHFIALPVGIAQFVRLINHHQVPGDRPDFLSEFAYVSQVAISPPERIFMRVTHKRFHPFDPIIGHKNLYLIIRYLTRLSFYPYEPTRGY